LSKYFKQALSRLSTFDEKPQAPKVSEVSDAEKRIQIHMDESLIIVQHDLISEQSIVI